MNPALDETPAPAGPSAAASAPRVLWATPDPPEPSPDVAHDLPRYRAWVAARQAERLAARRPRGDGAPAGPELALLLAVDDAGEPGGLGRCLASVAAQTVEGWRLSVALCGDLGPETEEALDEGLAALPPGRTGVHRCAPGTGTADALRLALEATGAPAFCVLGPEDRLAPDAVALLSEALVVAEVAYADEDRLDPQGLAVDPRLKPDWSPELALGCNYAGRPVAYRRAPAEAAGGIRALGAGDGDVEHDLLLRVTEGPARVAHVAEVLCSRRADPDHAGPATGGGAVRHALARRGPPGATVEPGPVPASWRVRRPVTGRHRVSVVVPFRDSTTFLRTCVDSVLATAGDLDLELVLVDNGSVEPETLTLIERLTLEKRDPAPGRRVRVHRDPRPFNWAALNNAAVAVSEGDVLLFLNDDVETRRPGWLEALVAQAVRPEVAAVGARLLYPSGRVQFAGTVVRLGGAAGHVLAGLDGEEPGYLGMAVLARDVTAVTGACMATRREVFDRLGGFDEGLGVDCNDVDYCLRARDAGYRVLYEPAAELVHHESPSRGTSGSNPDIARFVDRWEATLLAGDPFLNPHLTRTDLSPGLARPHELAQWWEWRRHLADP